MEGLGFVVYVFYCGVIGYRCMIIEQGKVGYFIMFFGEFVLLVFRGEQQGLEYGRFEVVFFFQVGR